MIASAGSLPLVDLAKSVSSLRQVIWVTEPSSKHMDWEGAPEHETGGKISVSVWDNLVQEATAATSELPSNDQGAAPGNLIFLWQQSPGGPAKIVEFTQKVWQC